MEHFGRRNFMRAGLSGIWGALGTRASAQSRSRSAQPEQADVPLECTLLLEPGAVHRLDRAKGARAGVSLWAVPGEFEAAAPFLARPLSLSIQQVEDWIRSNTSDCCSLPAGDALDQANPLEVLMRVPLVGSTGEAAIGGAATAALAEGRSLDLSLEFLLGDPTVAGSVRISDRAGLPVFDRSTSSAKDNERAAISVVFGGFKLVISGPDEHPLGECVASPVKHLHVAIFVRQADGSYRLAANYSLGVFRRDGRRCFVLFNDVAPVVCWIICNPTRADLVRMFKLILASAAALLGIKVPAWAIALIAELAASIVLSALMLLG